MGEGEEGRRWRAEGEAKELRGKGRKCKQNKRCMKCKEGRKEKNWKGEWKQDK